MILLLLLGSIVSAPGAPSARASLRTAHFSPPSSSPPGRIHGPSLRRELPHRRISTAQALHPFSSKRDSLDVSMYARLLQSADRRTLDTLLLAAAFESSSIEIRRAAARTLSQVALRHRTRSLPLLRAHLLDTDSVVVAAASLGLGLVKDTASIPTLASVVRDNGPGAPSAAWALGEIGPRARDTVAALLRATQPRRGSNSVVALLLAESKLRPLEVGSVVRYVSSQDTLVRWAAAYAIARPRNRAGARALLDASAPNAAFRAELARELVSEVAGDSLNERATARLKLLAADVDPFVRVNAVRSAGTYGTVMRQTMLAVLRDRDENVRVAAAQSVATVFGSSSADWNEAWGADNGYMYRKSLLASAAVAGYELPGAGEWRASSDWRLRHASLVAWSGSADTAHVRAIAMEMAHDVDARVRLAAFALLASTDTARADTLVQHALLAARSDPDSTVRNSLPGSRVRTLDTATVDRPLDFYEAAVRRVVIPTLDGRPPRAVMRTARGQLVITFDGVEAPLTVANFLTLAGRRYYDGLRFHRVVPAFVAQDGDPRGDGEGGPGYMIRDELTLLPYSRGAVGMALSGPDTGGSQYFLTLTPQPHLTGHYTVFGRVSAGMHVMDALVEGDAIRRVVARW